jgi:hypothetical protein
MANLVERETHRLAFWLRVVLNALSGWGVAEEKQLRSSRKHEKRGEPQFLLSLRSGFYAENGINIWAWGPE